MVNIMEKHNISKWQHFFSDCKITYSKNTTYPRAESFFINFRKLFVPAKKKEILLPQVEDVNLFFKGFADIYAPFVRNGGAINIWEIAQLKFDEIRNCSVLGWLLDCKGSHGQGSLFFDALLQSLNIENIDTSAGYLTRLESSYDIDIDDKHEISDSNFTSKKKRNRVDIVLENEEFMMFIEVKIYASEGHKQLKRYSDTLDKHCSGVKKGFLIFLTPFKNYIPEHSKQLSHVPCAISWRQVAQAFQGALPKRIHQENILQVPLWVAVVQQFCKYILKF